MLRDDHTAEDIVSKALEKYATALQSKVIDQPSAYLSTTIQRLCIDELRKRKREEKNLKELAELSRIESTEQTAEFDFCLDDLEQLHCLTPEEFYVLALRFGVPGLTYAEILRQQGKEVTKSSQARLRQVSSRALKKVRKHFQRIQPD